MSQAGAERATSPGTARDPEVDTKQIGHCLPSLTCWPSRVAPKVGKGLQVPSQVVASTEEVAAVSTDSLDCLGEPEGKVS